MDPVKFDPDRRIKAYFETGKISVDNLPIVKRFCTLNELVGFINGVVGRSNLKVTEFEAVVKVEAP